MINSLGELRDKHTGKLTIGAPWAFLSSVP